MSTSLPRLTDCHSWIHRAEPPVRRFARFPHGLQEPAQPAVAALSRAPRDTPHTGFAATSSWPSCSGTGNHPPTGRHPPGVRDPCRDPCRTRCRRRPPRSASRPSRTHDTAYLTLLPFGEVQYIFVYHKPRRHIAVVSPSCPSTATESSVAVRGPGTRLTSLNHSVSRLTPNA